MGLMSAMPDASSHDDANADVARLSYEQAREELVTVVGRLEAGHVPLEDALSLWERGEALAARCQAWLDEARRRLSAVSPDAAAGPAGAAAAPVAPTGPSAPAGQGPSATAPTA